MAALTPAFVRLRADYNVAFPRRKKHSDGWIGDAAHRKGRSAHNPDDTPGSLSEREDADSIAEVRGLDVDKDLESPITMQATVDRIIRSVRDRRRIIYVIYNRRIASRNAGWFRTNGEINWQPYNGDNAHTEHAHFSGDPVYDNDSAPWSVLEFAEDDMTNWEDTPLNGNPGFSGTAETAMVSAWEHAWYGRQAAQRTEAAVTALRAVVDGLVQVIEGGGGSVDTAAILAGVDQRLEAMREAQEAEMRDAVADLGEGGAAQVRGPQA